MTIKRKLYHFHFCCGLGGGAASFNRAPPRIGSVEAHCRLSQDQCPASSVASLGYHGYGKPRTTRIPHRPRAFRCDHLSL
ncbi:hypothetical protein IPC139_00455 [Pseudomonas aeruginosa]|nr:hypothetical protein CP913_02700 [Pseudomonas aeruginosa]KSK49075.2 hypothetical protein APA25_33830 [Pseudomonas aeruginosa]MCO3978021.1 hypothetical protein [Pseudomonas aeruginosa]PCM94400.1 hypothetical protein CP916_30915 [Pseudomonas aeruginosa]PCN00798.1 hypothetical protein CP915_31395 [Pseudomonas aeruginosa]